MHEYKNAIVAMTAENVFRAVIAVGESPKTEVTWYESTLRDATDKRVVARMLMMSRLLKASSPLWT